MSAGASSAAGDSTTSTSADASSVTVSSTTSPPGSSTQDATTTSSSSDDDDDDGPGFIIDVDAGASGCRQPEWVEQAPGCDDGTRAPGELCYQGVATRQAMPEGPSLARFGADARFAYAEVDGGIVHLGPATADGLLSEPTTLRVSGWANGLLVDDVDDDGALDLVVAQLDAEGAGVTVLRGVGPDEFEPWTDSDVLGMAHMRRADLDGDGRDDLVGTTDRYYETGALHFARESTAGAYADAGILALGEGVVFDVGDFDMDGIDDLAVVVLEGFQADERSLVTVPMTPDGPAPATTLEENVFVSRPVVGRFDADDLLDLAYSSDGALLLRAGLGDGTFQSPTVLERDPKDTPIAAFDLDGDGRSEIVGTSSVYSVEAGEYVFFDVGCGTYGTKAAGAGDVNEDGLADLLITTGYGQEAGSVHLVLSNP